MPALNFDIAGVVPEVRAGAGGILFLGNAPAPADLGRRLHFAGAFRPFVMADEEGGGIQRLAPLVADMPWPRDQAASMSVGAVRALGARVGAQMRAAGVTMDLAPVLDVDARPGPSASNPDGARAFSGDPSVVSSYGVAFARGLASAGVVPVVKHFPGLGGSSGNTDVTAASTLPLSTLRTAALPPFETAIRAGLPAVMVANASVPGLTSLPASLSRAVITGLLRQQLGFAGLVVTDSLSAGAVARVANLPDASVRALVAGADLVLFGSTLSDSQKAGLAPAAVQHTFDAIVTAIVGAVQSHRLTVARLDAAVLHVLTASHAKLCG